MTDDLLKAATQALRDETAEGEADGRFTRARVMASLHQGKVKRRTRLAFILPIAACLAAGTAWGAATGRLPAMFQALSQVVSYTRKAPAEDQTTRSKPSAAARQADVPAQPVPPSIDVPKAPALDAPKPEPKVRLSASGKVAPKSSAAFQDTDGDFYRLAHEAHFSSHDYAHALRGWEAYLQAAPRGRLATEARFNRAICLLRLGRDAEARQALEPFASAKMGYRQSEAQGLIDELSR